MGNKKKSPSEGQAAEINRRRFFQVTSAGVVGWSMPSKSTG